MQNEERKETKGIISKPHRPPDWIAPGPRPAGPQGRDDLTPREGEDLCYLSGDWRIFQRVDGHRYSLDDVATAWFAAESAIAHGINVESAADIGCGIGSVLMMTAWRFPAARFIGVETQQLSVGLARRSLAFNGADDRCEIRAGDLRDASVIRETAAFDLVTGTPPYFPPGNGTVSSRPQCGPCRFEERGGIEDYCAAAARLLAPHGVFACCFDARFPGRVNVAAVTAGLRIMTQLDVIPRTGRAPLFTLFAMSRSDALAHPLVSSSFSSSPSDLCVSVPLWLHFSSPSSPLTVRDDAGRWTPAFLALRAAMGFPPPFTLARSAGPPPARFKPT